MDNIEAPRVADKPGKPISHTILIHIICTASTYTKDQNADQSTILRWAFIRYLTILCAKENNNVGSPVIWRWCTYIVESSTSSLYRYIIMYICILCVALCECVDREKANKG